MESHKPRASQPQRDRQRSRSPSGSRLGTAAEPTFRTGRRARSLRRFQEVLDEMEANKEKWAAVEEKWAAEEERRHNLPPAERLKEDGQELLRELEDNDRMVFLLQETPLRHFRRARCRAGDCFYVQAKNPNGRDITDDYRICVDKGVSYDGKHYYHVLYFDWMIDLEKLIPSKFKMAGTSWQWGVIIRKWFEHKGCISLDKVAAYLEEQEAYEKEHKDFSREWIIWSRNHRECKAKPGPCPCPPPPKGPDKPVLKDYTTSEEDGCNLCDALEHLRVGGHVGGTRVW
jgi:hypothetical protein